MAEERGTVYVIDDDVSVRDAICGVLRSVGLRAQCFESTQTFSKERSDEGPSCLVLDVRLPGLSGLDFQRELAKADVRIPIIFITGYGDVPMSVRAMKAGAIEFLTKPFRDEDLLDAVREALLRDRTSREEAAAVSTLRERFKSLTVREAQVMVRVVAGKANKEIATEFGTSEITVKVQRARVMQKMAAETVVDLVKMSEKLQLGGYTSV